MKYLKKPFRPNRWLFGLLLKLERTRLIEYIESFLFLSIPGYILSVKLAGEKCKA